ncbi:DB module [Onchocerca flexuosa]|uniref:DB module n=1 Tax=Onchocerca flexuosa TaxID=387005 RepID=A0A238BSZ0_9BILA|nr:DB module [Onchocerca flexuosa]
MNSSLVIFVTAIFVILARGDDWQQLLEKREILTEMMRNEYFLGDEELMVPSRADERFRECCIAEIGDFYCTNQLCSISSISRMTPSALISHVLQCSRKMRKIWSCASQMRDQSDCCIERNVPEYCLNYCNGKMRLNLRQPEFLCFLHSKQIIQCLKDNLLS